MVAAKSVEALELVPVLKTRGRLMQKCCEGKEGIRNWLEGESEFFE